MANVAAERHSPATPNPTGCDTYLVVARRTAEQTRRLLIEVGLRLLHERGIYVGVTHVRLSDVAAAAGLTTGAAYRCWPNQDAFHRDLVVEAVRWRDRAPIAGTVANITDLVDARAPLAEVVRVGAEAHLHHHPEDTGFLITVALRMCASANSELAKASRERLAISIESFDGLYAALLPVYGRRMRAPFTVTQLTLSLIALAEGFELQAMTGDAHPRLHRPTESAGVGSNWTLLACAARAIIEDFTEPDPTVSPSPSDN